MSDPTPPDHLLDQALAAFFQPSSPPAGASSVTEFLVQAGVTDRVELRDLPGVPTPVVLPPSPGEGPRFAGKYQVRGELARGGVGIVFKGHDPELGRDVALKVLQQRHQAHGQLLQRFVAEAQIGGQLQHPGIVPVYDLGLQAGLPYFAMKLIQGRTLSALLQERKHPADERRRFLQIFEQVCQTVAYAHARGVVHRDLKPSNVMVGAFGEVQVVDWGMAKVLPTGGVADERRASQRESESFVRTVREQPGSSGSDSVAGSVMGTVAYMPPEQARGDVEALDERADVFALGAILCEILTGKPPYVGERDQVLLMAARGDLAAAHGRLEQSGADGELIALAKQCLTKELAARPRHAGIVAERVAGFVASLEQRVQAARVAAAEDRVKAQAARRTQRLTLGLAASVLCTILVAGGGYLWLEGAHARRSTEVGLRIAKQLDKANQIFGRAKAAVVGDLSPWKELNRVIEGAKELIGSEDASEAVRSRVNSLGEEIVPEERAAIARAARAEQDRRMIARLEDIASAIETPYVGPDAALQETAYFAGLFFEAFREYGIDIEAEEGEVVAKIAESSIGVELATALDVWAGRAFNLHKTDAQDGVRLMRIASLADPEPLRRRIREIIGPKAVDGPALRALLKEIEPDIDSLSPATAMLLGRACHEAGLKQDCHSILRRVWLSHPGNVGLNLMLGEILQETNAQEAEVYLGAVLALRPSNPLALHDIGRGAEHAHNWDLAEAAYRLALKRGTDEGHFWFHIAYVRDQRGDKEGALAASSNAAKLSPRDSRIFRNLAGIHQKAGELEAALDAMNKALELQPKNGEYHMFRGLILRLDRQLDKAEQECLEAIKLEPNLGWAYGELGNVLEEKGQPTEALEKQQKCVALIPSDPGAWLNLSTAQQNVGNLAEAIASMRKAVRLDPIKRDWNLRLVKLSIEHGELHAGLASCIEAARLDPKDARWETMTADIYQVLGRDDQERMHREAACRLAPNDSSCSMALALAFSKREMYAEAAAGIDKAIAAGADPARWSGVSVPADWVAKTRAQAEKEAPFLSIMRGSTRASDPREACEAAVCAERRNLHVRAMTLFEDAFAADPKLVENAGSEYRCVAAASAAQAGCGLAEDARQVDRDQRASWRRLAMRWLTAEREAWQKRIADGDWRMQARACDVLGRLLRDPVFECVRNVELIPPTNMPTHERTAWSAFWKGLDKMRSDLLAEK